MKEIYFIISSDVDDTKSRQVDVFASPSRRRRRQIVDDEATPRAPVHIRHLWSGT